MRGMLSRDGKPISLFAEEWIWHGVHLPSQRQSLSYMNSSMFLVLKHNLALKCIIWGVYRMKDARMNNPSRSLRLMVCRCLTSILWSGKPALLRNCMELLDRYGPGKKKVNISLHIWLSNPRCSSRWCLVIGRQRAVLSPCSEPFARPSWMVQVSDLYGRNAYLPSIYLVLMAWLQRCWSICWSTRVLLTDIIWCNFTLTLKILPH